MATDFPTTWQVLPLEECMEAIIDYRGKTPNKTSSGVPLITAKIVRNGRIEKPKEFINPEVYESWMRRGIPKQGDVVVTTEAPLGEVAQIDGSNVALAQRLITLRGKQGLLDNTFLKFLMQSVFVQNQLKSRETGTTVLGIKQSELRKVQLVIPPLPEQRTIAHVLGTLDDKIELNHRMNETLEAMARAVFKSWFVSFEPVRAKAEDRDTGLPKEIADFFPNKFEESELGEIPEGWRIGSILDYADLLSGGTPKTSIPEYWGGDIPWVSASDVSTSHSHFILTTARSITKAGVENSSAKVLPQGTTIITARGTVGSVAMLGRDMAMNQTNYGLKAKNGTGDYYVFYSLDTLIEYLKMQAYGTVFDTITTKTFKDTEILIPSMEVIQKFEVVVTPLMDLILLNLQQSRSLSAIRDTFLPKLMSGDIRIPTNITGETGLEET